MEPILRVQTIDRNVQQVHDIQRRKHQSPEEIRKVAQEFEGIFLENILKTMRRTIPKSGLFDGGQQEEIYASMFDQALAERMAQRGIGLAPLIQRQLELQQNPHVRHVDVRI